MTHKELKQKVMKLKKRSLQKIIITLIERLGDYTDTHTAIEIELKQKQ